MERKAGVGKCKYDYAVNSLWDIDSYKELFLRKNLIGVRLF